MDLYSDLRVPFNVAAFCRQRKFNPVAVQLLQAIRATHATKQAVLEAETSNEEAESALQRAILSAQEWIQSTGG
jgi:hypothetical protein